MHGVREKDIRSLSQSRMEAMRLTSQLNNFKRTVEMQPLQTSPMQSKWSGKQSVCLSHPIIMILSPARRTLLVEFHQPLHEQGSVLVPFYHNTSFTNIKSFVWEVDQPSHERILN